MIPILYNKNETNFTSNGLGRLADCISCTVTEERNGIYECQFTYPVTGEMFSEIQEGRIIAVIHDDVKDIQPFDIYAHSAPLNGVVTFYAHHISYRLGSIILKPMEASSCADVLSSIPNSTYNSCPFTFWTDKDVSGRWVNNVPSAVKAVLGGQQGSILDVYGKGEYKWDKFNVRLYVNRGNDNGVSIRYGVNLTDLNQDYDESSIYNAVVPYWINNENGTVVTLANGIVARGRLPWTTLSGLNITDRAGNIIYFGGNNRIVPVPMDLTEAFDEQPTEQQLEAEAMRRLNSSEAWLPSENITVKFVNLADTEEYKNVAALQRVSLCDKVSVYCGPLNVSAVKMQVIRVVYNVLTERYNEIELGKAKVSFSQTITAKIEEMTKDLPTMSAMQKAIDNATDQITGAKGGHLRDIYDANGNRQEMVVMDTEDISTAVKVWRWNLGGLGYSSDGYDGPYTTAITQDGSIVADFITTGILNAAIVKAGILGDAAEKNYWNMLTGEFSLSGDAGLGESTVGDVLDAVDAAISNVDVEYAQNQSTTTAPTSGWSTTAPAWRDGYYIWQRTATTTNDGTTYSEPTCISGRDGVDGQTGPQGPQGATGATGIGVSAVVEQYYLSTSNSTQTGGSWSTDQPQWVSGKYIWTRSHVTWTDNTTTDTTPVLAQAINGANSAASSAQSAVTTLDNSLDQQGVFDRLTNNGQTQGIYLDNGLLYINASYIGGGIIDGTVVQAKLLNIVNEDEDIISSFADTIVLGNNNYFKFRVLPNSISFIKSDGTPTFQYGDLRDESGVATLEYTFVGNGRNTRFEVQHRISSILIVKVNNTVLPEDEYSFGTPSDYYINLKNAPADGANIYVKFTSNYECMYFTVGLRKVNSVIGNNSVSIGNYNIASGAKSYAIGTIVEASGESSHAEGYNTKAIGDYSHVEGRNNTASGNYSHAEGGSYNINQGTVASGSYSHAEGSNSTTASGESSHAEGNSTTASGSYSHAEGNSTTASGSSSHAEGYGTTASGSYSHAEGNGTTANYDNQHVTGKYNISGNNAEIVGNGFSGNRSNARTLDWSGNEWIAGTLTQASDSRLKEESGEVPDLSDIRARRFKWNDKKGAHDNLEHIGYYAQDVEDQAPYLVQEDAMGYKSLDYIALLCAKVEYLERRVQQLENEVKRHDD